MLHTSVCMETQHLRAVPSCCACMQSAPVPDLSAALTLELLESQLLLVLRHHPSKIHQCRGILSVSSAALVHHEVPVPGAA